MYKVKYIWMLLALILSLQVLCSLRCVKSAPKKYFYEEQISDSILAIKINSEFWIHWNQNKYLIQNDSLLDSVKVHFDQIKEDLSYRISNLSNTHANACGKRDLLMGDIVLILILDIGNIDNNHTIRTQLDVHDMGCPYPQGFFELVDKDREKISERVLLYYQR